MRAARLGVLVAAAAAAHAAPSFAALPALRFPGVTCRRAAENLALTFDDGPAPDGTPAVLQALAAAGLTATFYVVGEQVERHPEVLAEIVAGGHPVGLHGYRHVPHALMTPRAVLADLERGLAVVEDATGLPVASLRAPYGAASLATLRFAASQGLEVAGWSRWGRDWERRATPGSIRSPTMSSRRARAGARRCGPIVRSAAAQTPGGRVSRAGGRWPQAAAPPADR